jgi:hypothetical protein
MADVRERAARPAGDGDGRWVLHAADRALIGNKAGATRLGFAVLLKLFAAEGRFPRCAEDVPLAAVEAVAGQVGVTVTAWQGYDWHGRTIEYHRAQIRAALGFREATLDDAEALGRWLDSQVLALERRPDRLLAAARERCRDQSVEPPSPERLERLVRSVLHRHEDAFCAALLARLPPEAIAGLEALLHPPGPGDAAGSEPRPVPPFLGLRAGTGQASLQSVGEEAAKLACIRALALPAAAAADILRRFTRANVQHPTYRALVELGKALRSTFVCRYLYRMELRREIHEGLNVVENWNSANDFILYGRGGEIATNRLEDQEATMLSLHLLQNCMVYVNTLMIQRVLAEPAWMARMGPDERRGLTPLGWGHVNPYGTFHLDMTARLPLDLPTPAADPAQLLFQGV